MSPLFTHIETYAQSLDQYLIQDRDASFMLTIESDRWKEDGIFSGDMIIVERGREPRVNDFILVSSNGGFSLERFPLSKNKLPITESTPSQLAEVMQIDGVVTTIIRKLLKN